MQMKGNKTEEKRFVPAPTPSASVRPGQVNGVYLGPDEEVTWEWTHYPDGTSAVTGYTIAKAKGGSWTDVEMVCGPSRSEAINGTQ